ncbi:MAG: DUF4293 family protein [Balneolaceae bacterium]
MIQRIQTIFLLLAALSSVAVYFTPIYTRAMEDPQEWIGFGLAISLVVASILSLYSIFLFKNRKSQIAWVKRAALVEVIALGFSTGVFFSLGGIGTYLWDEAIGTGLIVLSFGFQLLALKFIHKDEKLVKSMDRIR